MSEPAQKCETCEHYFEVKLYSLKIFVAFKRANSCCFGLREN